jgi:hypothetical protein
MVKESYTELVIRMDEKLKNIVETLETTLIENKIGHGTIIDSIKELTLHVNHENEKMSNRITLLEDQHRLEEGKKKGQVFIYKVVIAILTTSSILLSILAHFGVI